MTPAEKAALAEWTRARLQHVIAPLTALGVAMWVGFFRLIGVI